MISCAVFLQLIVKVGKMVNLKQLSLRFNRGMKTRPKPAKMGLSSVLSDAHGGASDLLLPVPEHEREFAKLHVTEIEEQNDYFDYFRYVMEIRNLQTPCNWREAV